MLYRMAMETILVPFFEMSSLYGLKGIGKEQLEAAPIDCARKLVQVFSSLPDKRVQGRSLHRLDEIITITFLALLCYCENVEEIAAFGKAFEPWLKTFMILEHGAPSESTYYRAYRALSPQALEAVSSEYLHKAFNKIRTALNVRAKKDKEKQKKLEEEEHKRRQVACDGKSLNGSGRGSGAKKEASNTQILHIYDVSTGICLYSETIDEKTNEIPVLQKSLPLIDIKGAIVSFDALNTQKETVSVAIDLRADYICALKQNHEGFSNSAQAYFSEERLEALKAQGCYIEHTEKANNNIVVRRHWIERSLEWLECKGSWAGLKAIVYVEREMTNINTHAKSVQTEMYITSLEDDLCAAESLRAHWRVENCLNWHLDVSFGEDSSKIAGTNANANLSVLRKMALSFCKLAKPVLGTKSIKATRKAFSWQLGEKLGQILSLFDDAQLFEEIAHIA